MPHKIVYVNAAKDPLRKTYEFLPEVYDMATGILAPCLLSSKDGTLSAKPEDALHFCRQCGWVEGWPNQYPVDTLDKPHLAGRMGTDYHCAKCGDHIGFSGYKILIG